MFTIYCDSISFNKVTSLVDRMSYYCLKKTSTEIEFMTTLGTENDLLHSKTFYRESVNLTVISTLAILKSIGSWDL